MTYRNQRQRINCGDSSSSSGGECWSDSKLQRQGFG